MKTIIRLTLFFVVVLLAACGNKVKSDINDYKSQMKDVQSEEKKLVDSIDQLELDKVDQLIGSEVTAKKKERLKTIEEDLNNNVQPQLNRYEKKLDAVTIKTDDVKKVHEIYVDNFKKKKKFIQDMQAYIKLYNQSIASNEEILDYTKVFEKNKALTEKYGEKAMENSSEIADYNALSSKINKNSAELKTKVEYLMGNATVAEKQKYIDDKLLPLLDKYVTQLNKTKITSTNVIQMRKAQTEIYYSLMNYYKERKSAMVIEEKLQNMPIQQILANTKMIKSMDDKYYHALKKLEEKA